MPIKIQNGSNKFVVPLSGHSTAALLKAGGLLATPREPGGLQAGSTEGCVGAEEERLHELASWMLAQVAMMVILFPVVVLLLPSVGLAGRAVSTMLWLQSRIISGDLRLPWQRPTWVMVSLLWPCSPPVPPTFLGASPTSHCAARGCGAPCSRQSRVEGEQHLSSTHSLQG